MRSAASPNPDLMLKVGKINQNMSLHIFFEVSLAGWRNSLQLSDLRKTVHPAVSHWAPELWPSSSEKRLVRSSRVRGRASPPARERWGLVNNLGHARSSNRRSTQLQWKVGACMASTAPPLARPAPGQVPCCPQRASAAAHN